MDLVVRLPESEGYESTWAVADRPTKQRNFATRKPNITAKGTGGPVPCSRA